MTLRFEPTGDFPTWNAVRRTWPGVPTWTASVGDPIVREEVPLTHYKFGIGLAAVVLLVALRITIGWHFFYEGVWKIDNADKFSAEPFLSTAKGPAAPVFYAMLPDIDGRRLIESDAKGNRTVTAKPYTEAWKKLNDRVISKYGLDEKQQKQFRAIFDRYAKSADNYLKSNRDVILAHFASLDRFQAEVRQGNNGASFQQARQWDKQSEYRGASGRWTGDLDALGDEYQSALWYSLSDEQKQSGHLPTGWTQMDLMDFAVTYGLTAIGLCLMIGLCTRLAALGGAAFLVAVLLTQPPWPTIYPPFPEVVGHALVVDKNFVELIALLVLATLPVGRWAGLDFFLYNWIGRPIENYFAQKA